MKSQYIQGETAEYSLADRSYTSVTLNYGAKYIALTKSESTWHATFQTSALCGRVRYAAIADGHAVETGSFTVVPLVSRYRAVLEAIDAALQGVATNGKYSITVGEISLQDKTFSEMLTARNYYARLADAEETGATPSFGPARVSEVYA